MRSLRPPFHRLSTSRRRLLRSSAGVVGGDGGGGSGDVGGEGGSGGGGDGESSRVRRHVLSRRGGG